MFTYLPEIKKVFKTIITKTDELEELNKKVDELMCDELVKDCCLNRFHKEESSRYFIYEVKQEDFDHITGHLDLIQKIITPHLVVMAQTDEVDSFRILFRKG